MGKFVMVLLIFSLGGGSEILSNDGRTKQLLRTYINTDTSFKVNTALFSSFLDQLEEKKGKFRNERDFVRFIFHKTHQKFLKRFEAYSSFSELLHNGNYNCLTGTSLYALILNHFNIQHSIIETNYHIFILVTADKGTVLLEATDPLNGYVESAKEINERLLVYRENHLQQNSEPANLSYQFSFNLWESASLDELTGLLYFNKAVQAYNEHQLEHSALFLVQAETYHPSERIQEFAVLVMMTIANSELNVIIKERLIHQLKAMRRQSVQIHTASVGE